MEDLRNPNISRGTNSSITIDHVHNEIHEGEHYILSKLFTGVANDGFADILVTVSATKRPHMTANIVCEGKAYAYIYSAPTTSVGTDIVAKNNDYAVDTLALTTFKFTPTVTNAGTEVFTTLINGGTGGTALGSVANTRIERILKKSTAYLFRIQNKSGLAKDISIELAFYEEEY